MTKIEKYICEFCGKEFDDETECSAHEIQEKFYRTYQSTVFFGCKFNEISVEDILDGESNIDAFQVFEENEIPLIKELFEEIGLCSPWKYEGGELPERTGLYVWDYEHDRWLMPAKVIEEMNEVLKQYGVGA